MTADSADGAGDVKVVRNDEEQYSIWDLDRENPPGWHDVGFSGTKDACLGHIETVWTDMRPRSLRSAPERSAAGQK